MLKNVKFSFQREKNQLCFWFGFHQKILNGILFGLVLNLNYCCSGLPCYFHPAPSRVKHLQIQFSSQLNQKLNLEKLQILDDSSGPTVVFSVNASRVISDIQRDLKAGAFYIVSEL
jgi:hypothetical protein